MYLTCTLILISCYATLLSSFPTGAPESACENLTPNHNGYNSQDSPSPYFINVSSASANQSTYYRVSIGSGSNMKFMGFMLEAFDWDDNPIGMFTTLDKNTQFRCDNASVTHRTRLTVGNVTFMWSPDGYTGDVEFRATVVQSFGMFWYVPSFAINIETSESDATSATTDTTTNATEAATSTTIIIMPNCGMIMHPTLNTFIGTTVLLMMTMSFDKV